MRGTTPITYHDNINLEEYDEIIARWDLKWMKISPDQLITWLYLCFFSTFLCYFRIMILVWQHTFPGPLGSNTINCTQSDAIQSNAVYAVIIDWKVSKAKTSSIPSTFYGNRPAVTKNRIHNNKLVQKYNKE